ncbi:MAG: hypothetical protein IJ042_08960 [Butyricicoccus sp.]|nr:hypothetical protein [Butyricicoccus sp.]
MTYQNYTKEIDYAEQITKMMERGATSYEVEDMLNRRVNKALDNEELRQYAYDDFYKTARSYIDTTRTEELGGSGSAAGAAGYAGEKFTDSYADERAAVIEKLSNRSFSYDPDTDPAYQSYVKQYRRESQRASRDAMAQAATLTGGQASTAAVSAATQAADYYNSKAGDVLPEIYKLAYQMYAGENQTLLDQLDALTGLSEREYDRWYAADAAAYERQQAANDTAYERYLDTMERAQADNKTTTANRAQASETAYERAMAFLNQGVMPTEQMLAAADITKAQAEALRANALRKKK